MDKEQFLKVLGSRIRFFRERAGMTQSELARAIGLSAEAGAISQVERGMFQMESLNLVNISKALHIHPAALMTEKPLTNEDLVILSDFLKVLESKDSSANWGAIKTLIQADAKELT